MRKLARLAYARALDLLRGTGIGKYRVVRRLDEFIVSLLKSPSVVIDGHTLMLDANDSLRLSLYGVYEPLETELMKREIKPGDVVVDVGANIGYYTLLAARQVGPAGKVYAFEPDAANFALLRKNVALNGYANVVLVNKAVSDRTGVLKLYLAQDNTGDHRAYAPDESRDFVSIDCVSLDDFFRGKEPRVDMIKMDIQGFECSALRGMRDTVKNAAKLKLTAEYWPHGLHQAGESAANMISLLRDFGFKLFVISEERKSVIPADVDGLLRDYDPREKNYTNLFCVKD